MSHDDNSILIQDDTMSSPSSELIAERAAQIRVLLARLDREKIIDLWVNVASCDANVYQRLTKLTSTDPNTRKLFVRGIGYSCSDEKLRELFSEHGEIEEAVVCVDKDTKRSKGFGFVTYKDVSSVTTALKAPAIKHDGRVLPCNVASLKQGFGSDRAAKRSRTGEYHSMSQGYSAPSPMYSTPYHSSQQNSYSPRPGSTSNSARKLFIRGLNYNTTHDQLRHLFEQYGDVQESTVIIDRSTGKSKGFGFITFCDSNSANKALAMPEKELDGRLTRCHLATPVGSNTPASSRDGGEYRSHSPYNQASSMGYYYPSHSPHIRSGERDGGYARPYGGSRGREYAYRQSY